MRDSEGGGSVSNLPTFVLVTPARNEADYIELTIQSVVRQAVLPAKWVIVSDGSTDGTDDIVKKYAAQYPWIELLRMPERTERHFAGKVAAFNAGYDRVKDIRFDVIGNIDGDVSFEPDFFQFLLARFSMYPSLGIAGAVCIEDQMEAYDYSIVNVHDVSGACQLFRRECFSDVGGYTPIKGGGIDSVAVYTARMKGWETRTFTEASFFHHRARGGAQGDKYVRFIKAGKRDYNLGGHPLWHTLRSLYQMKHYPYIIGGFFLFWGYWWEFLKGTQRPIRPELVEFLQKEQMERLRGIVRRKLGPLAGGEPGGTG